MGGLGKQPEMPEACKVRFSEFAEVTLGLRKGILELEERLGGAQVLVQDTNVSLGECKGWFGAMEKSMSNLRAALPIFEQKDNEMQALVGDLVQRLVAVEERLQRVTGTKSSADPALTGTTSEPGQVAPALTAGAPCGVRRDAPSAPVPIPESFSSPPPRGGEPYTPAQGGGIQGPLFLMMPSWREWPSSSGINKSPKQEGAWSP